MSSVQQALNTSFEFIGSPLLVHVDTKPRSPNQAPGANCQSVMQIMIRKMGIGHRVRVPVFTANGMVTDEARTGDLRSPNLNAWVHSCSVVFEAKLRCVQECPEEDGLQCDCRVAVLGSGAGGSGLLSPSSGESTVPAHPFKGHHNILWSQ
jgi:hypothetical protein